MKKLRMLALGVVFFFEDAGDFVVLGGGAVALGILDAFEGAIGAVHRRETPVMRIGEWRDREQMVVGAGSSVHDSLPTAVNNPEQRFCCPRLTSNWAVCRVALLAKKVSCVAREKWADRHTRRQFAQSRALTNLRLPAL